MSNLLHVSLKGTILLDATKDVSGFDEKKNEFKIPTLGKKIGESILKCTAISFCFT